MASIWVTKKQLADALKGVEEYYESLGKELEKEAKKKTYKVFKWSSFKSVDVHYTSLYEYYEKTGNEWFTEKDWSFKYRKYVIGQVKTYLKMAEVSLDGKIMLNSDDIACFSDFF